jgi:hypothetical protein
MMIRFTAHTKHSANVGHAAVTFSSPRVQTESDYPELLSAAHAMRGKHLRSFTELNKEIRTRSELIGTNNDHGLPRKYTFDNQRNNNFCDDAATIIAMTQQQLLRQQYK